jgi:membrane-bound lytic murein transglycosylase B
MKKLVLLFICLSFYITQAFAIDLGRRPDIQAYIQMLSQQYGFDQAQLTSWFNQTEFLKLAVPKSQKAKKPKPFYMYRNALITPARVQAGVIYWQQHKAALLAAEQRYGVPVEVLLGILGVETTYGENTGHYSAFQGLATLAFNHPSRRPYFTSELTHYLLLCREQNWNPLLVRSSFDGGLGLPQFMPSSYRMYAVSAHGGKPNLFDDDDAIASMANYLRAKGWQAEQPIAIRAKLINKQRIRAMQAAASKKTTLAEIKQRYGLMFPQNMPAGLTAAILPLQHPRQLEYWLGFENFSVIKKYNNSTNYAMTIYQLGSVIRSNSRPGFERLKYGIYE